MKSRSSPQKLAFRLKSSKSRFTSSSTGFTLIEILVVVTLSVMLMLAASSLFMTLLLSNTKTTSAQLVKVEGDQALNQMEFLLRNAVEIIPNSSNQQCTTAMDSISLVSIDGGETTLFSEVDNEDGMTKIASNSGVYLTSGAVTLEAGPTFDCVESPDGLNQYITISFTLSRGTLSEQRERVEELFTTGVNIRSY